MGSQKTNFDQREITRALTRGVCRLFHALGFVTLTEFKLTNGRRVDVIAMDPNGDFSIIEIKSTVADYKADHKWQDYLPYCQQFYFAVPFGFPIEIIATDCGIIVADAFEAVVRKDSFSTKLNSIRKRHQLIRFARAASNRLANLDSMHINYNKQPFSNKLSITSGD